MKNSLKQIVVAILAWQLKRLHKKHQFKVIAVVGSIGKTSTKLAVARVLSESYRVRFQEGNYNNIVTVPLIFFNQVEPALTNPLAWVKVFIKNESLIKNYPYDIVVIELGIDHPNEMAGFKKYIKADLAVVTALTAEHMENFESLSEVAQEEMTVSSFSQKLLINKDLCPSEYLESFSGAFLSYAIKQDATYRLIDLVFRDNSASFSIQKDGTDWIKASQDNTSEPQLYSLLAAVAVAELMGMTPDAVVKGIDKIVPVAGRMQRLEGKKSSVIIDDTYNSSPDASKAALDTIYRMEASQKIALLGNMNELGAFSPTAHTDVGSYCDPQQLKLVVTLGPDANSYLAAAAEKKGCKVVRTSSPHEAGRIILDALEEGGLILAKGSQNGVFAEEAVKQLLNNPADASKLVRQSDAWLAIKQKQFSAAVNGEK